MPHQRPAVQAARNESVFREVNEHLEAAADGDPGEVHGFVCECADISCTVVVAVPLGDYARIREDPRRFIVAPHDAHVDDAVERIVERAADYWVVAKRGAAGEVAEELDEEA